MSSKFHALALAVLLTLAAIAPGPVLAHSGSLFQPQKYDLNKPLPLGARGSSALPGTSEPLVSRPFETDPDPHVRFEMNRDDRDRRAGRS